MKPLTFTLLCFMAIFSAKAQTESAKTEKEPLTFFDQPPTLPGGYEEFLRKNIKYPVYALKNNIQGTVYIQLVINEDGTIRSSKLLKSVDSSLNNEALRVVNLMPRWNPGRNNGVPVPVRMNIPIKFVLEDDEPTPNNTPKGQYVPKKD